MSFSLLVAYFFCCTISAQNAQPKLVSNPVINNNVEIEWAYTVHDYGKIPQGVPANSTFTLTNTGDTPLLIMDVKTSCGCTVAQATKEPILPGESTSITTTYNAKKKGHFNKPIKVMTNRSDKPIVLKIKGEVVE